MVRSFLNKKPRFIVSRSHLSSSSSDTPGEEVGRFIKKYTRCSSSVIFKNCSNNKRSVRVKLRWKDGGRDIAEEKKVEK